jgi:hypothetical protein
MGGIAYLRTTRRGAPDAVLLLVYPITAGDFTARALCAYRGDWVVSVGTQGAGGYTGFRDEVVGAWMERECGWQMLARVPVPSFAAKDDAVFVFGRVGRVR